MSIGLAFSDYPAKLPPPRLCGAAPKATPHILQLSYWQFSTLLPIIFAFLYLFLAMSENFKSLQQIYIRGYSPGQLRQNLRLLDRDQPARGARSSKRNTCLLAGVSPWARVSTALSLSTQGPPAPRQTKLSRNWLLPPRSSPVAGSAY